jgi:hypothetical protein
MENVTEVYKPTEYTRAVKAMQTLYRDREAAEQACKKGKQSVPRASEKKMNANRVILDEARMAYDKAIRSVVTKIRVLARDYFKVYDESEESEAKMNFDQFLSILGDHRPSMLQALKLSQKRNGIGLDWYFKNLVPIGDYFPLIQETETFRDLKSDGEANNSGRADLMGAVAWYYVLEEEKLLESGFKEMMAEKESEVNDKITLERMLDIARTERIPRMKNCKTLELACEKFARETGSPERMMAAEFLQRDAEKSQRELAIFIEVNCAVDWFILSLRIRTGRYVAGAFAKTWNCFTDTQHKAAVAAGHILDKRPPKDSLSPPLQEADEEEAGDGGEAGDGEKAGLGFRF